MILGLLDKFFHRLFHRFPIILRSGIFQMRNFIPKPSLYIIFGYLKHLEVGKINLTSFIALDPSLLDYL